MEYATGHKRDVRGAIMDENSYMSPKQSMYVRLWQILGNLIAGVLLKYYICHLKHGEGKVGSTSCTSLYFDGRLCTCVIFKTSHR